MKIKLDMTKLIDKPEKNHWGVKILKRSVLVLKTWCPIAGITNGNVNLILTAVQNLESQVQLIGWELQDSGSWVTGVSFSLFDMTLYLLDSVSLNSLEFLAAMADWWLIAAKLWGSSSHLSKKHHLNLNSSKFMKPDLESENTCDQPTYCFFTYSKFPVRMWGKVCKSGSLFYDIIHTLYIHTLWYFWLPRPIPRVAALFSPSSTWSLGTDSRGGEGIVRCLRSLTFLDVDLGCRQGPLAQVGAISIHFQLGVMISYSIISA